MAIYPREYRNNMERLALEMQAEAKGIAATADAIKAAADALAERNDEVEKAKGPLSDQIRRLTRQLAIQERRVARIAETASRALVDGPKGSAARKRLKKLAASLGQEDTVRATAFARQQLAHLASPEAWNAIAFGYPDGKGNVKVVNEHIFVPSPGQIDARHPREIARIILMQVFDVDPDAPGFADEWPWRDTYEDDD